MVAARRIFEADPGVPLDSLVALLGRSREVNLHTQSVANIAALSTAVQVSTLPVRHGTVGSFTIQLPGAGTFEVGSYQWLGLEATAVGDTLVDGTTGLTVVENDGSATILVGRTEGNLPLLQAGTYTTAESPLLASVTTLEFDGGLLDLRLQGSVGRHRVCMACRSATEPQSPGVGGHYNGRAMHDLTVGGVTWQQAGDALPPGTDKIWFAFGESSFNTIRGQWTLSPNWVIVDSTDTDYSIEYATTWTGPWNQDAYAVASSKYARYRDPGGRKRIRRIGNDLSGADRDWVPVWELDIPSVGNVWENQRADTNFDFYPDDFLLARLEYEFDSQVTTLNGVVERALASLLFHPSIMRPNFASRSHTRHMMVRFHRDGVASGISVGYLQVAGRIGNSTTLQGFILNANGGSDGSLPITAFTTSERGNQFNSGTLRLWVL